MPPLGARIRDIDGTLAETGALHCRGVGETWAEAGPGPCRAT